MLCRRKPFKVSLKQGIFFTTALLGFVAATLAVEPLILSGKQSGRPAGTFSAGIAEVIKLLDANVETPVVLSYIANSPTPYDPEAKELLVLKEHGASTEVLKALLHRGDELRVQLAQVGDPAMAAPFVPFYDYPPEVTSPPEPEPQEPQVPESVEAPNPGPEYGGVVSWPGVYGGPGRNPYRPYWYKRGAWQPEGKNGRHESAVRDVPPVAAASHPAAIPNHRSAGEGNHANGGHSNGHGGGRSR